MSCPANDLHNGRLSHSQDFPRGCGGYLCHSERSEAILRGWSTNARAIQLDNLQCICGTGYYVFIRKCEMVESMKNRGLGPVPSIHGLVDGRYHVEFTAGSVVEVFNDLYDAAYEEEVWNKKKTRGKGAAKEVAEPKRTDTQLDQRTGKEKTVFIYEQLVPKGGFLSSLQMPSCWLKLWRDCLWATVRDRDRKRIPYKERSEKRNATLGSTTWEQMLRFQHGLEKGQAITGEVSSSLYVGAQASNAELVPFMGRVDENLLLHFWPVVTGVFQPLAIDRDGKPKFEGYALTIPDVIDLKRFARSFRQAVAELDEETVMTRPRGALITVPQEGALEYMHQLIALAKAHQEAQSIALSVLGIEVFWLVRKGNNVNVIASDRISVSEETLDEYDAIRDRYRHTLFRRQMILNLLHEKPWYQGFNEVFDNHPHELFIGNDATYFRNDVVRRFRLQLEEGRAVNE